VKEREAWDYITAFQGVLGVFVYLAKRALHQFMSDRFSFRVSLKELLYISYFLTCDSAGDMLYVFSDQRQKQMLHDIIQQCSITHSSCKCWDLFAWFLTG
jgi:hypothetical protein